MTPEELAAADLDDLRGDITAGIYGDDRMTRKALNAALDALAELVRRAEMAPRIAREAFILGAKAAHEDTVEGRYNCDPGYDWDCDPQILADAADSAAVHAANEARHD